jgi:hypothetical protein
MLDRGVLKAYAEDLIHHHAGDVEFLSIIDMAHEEFPVNEDTGEHISDEEARIVDDFISKAVVTVGWMDDEDLEYLLEERTRRTSDGEWTPWYNGCGYNNKNGGVYTGKNPLKGVMSRSRRRFESWGWEVEFRVSARPAVKPPWKQVEFDG